MDKTELIITTAKDLLIAYKGSTYTDANKFKDVVKMVAEVVGSLESDPGITAKK